MQNAGNQLTRIELHDIAAEGVCQLLGVTDGLDLESTARIEVILGLLSELRVHEGRLLNAFGRAVCPKICRNVLARLGACTGKKASDRECLKLCRRMSVIRESLLKRIAERVLLPARQLERYFLVLDERGYRLRLRCRIFDFCQPIPEPQPDSLHLPVYQPSDLALAA